MRIIGGDFRGRALASVGKGDAAAHLRPTTDRVRESLFNVLQGGRYGDPIKGAHVLDLFAGSGALSLEAVSRGAASAILVENGRRGQALIRENIALCRAQDNVRLVGRDARRLGPAPDRTCNLVFLDPPYGKGLGEPALASAVSEGWIANDALIVWEETEEITPPTGMCLVETRRFGTTKMHFLRAQHDA